MKTLKILLIWVLALGIIFSWTKASEAAPMGTAFTYQGHLYDANQVANNLYDFQFKLYDDPNAVIGQQIGGNVNVADIDVIDGYFTVELDFGSNVFNGDARWLEIGIRPGPENDPCEYTPLSPCQEVTAAPYALQTRGIFVDNALNVGIGTQSPAGKLHVDGGKAFSGTLGANLMFKGQDGGDGWTMQPDGAPGGDIILLPGEGGDEMREGSPGPDGNVGIGTITPTTKLDVAGTVTATAFVGDGSGLTGIAGGSGWIISGNDMYSLPSGNVGIGTASPAYPLHVKKTNANNWIAGFHNEGTGAQVYGVVVRADGGDPLLVQAGSLNALNVKQNGNIGIGTTSPTSKLQVAGDLEVDGNAEVGGTVNADNMPGCEYVDGINVLDVPTDASGVTNITSVSLTLKAGGYVIVTFSGFASMGLAGDSIKVHIGSTGASGQTFQICKTQTPGDDIPFSVQYVYSVPSAGTYTYYGNADSKLGSSDIFRATMTAIYVPNRY